MKDDNNIYLMFEKAATLYPDECCLLNQNTSLTYKQVDEEVSKILFTILKYAKNEKIIGLPTRRGMDQVIFMLAILKAGKAYLPIDFGYPKSRIQNMIKNSNLTFCLSTKVDEDIILAMGLRLFKTDNLSSDTNCIQDPMSQNAAYILYTSGSTGEPKGVCMGQEALINLINWQNKNSEVKNGGRTLQFAPLSFDVSFQEIMATLSTGGTLVLIEDTLRLDMVALLNFIKQKQVNRLFLPFVALQALAEAAISSDVFPNSLKEIMTAGEQLKITPQIGTFFTKAVDCILFNQYGPTECHVVTELKLEGDPSNWPKLPTIGKPISNTSILILNQKQEKLKNGEVGELYIAGECLAEGYLNNKQLTNEKFIEWKSPEGKNIRVYRSGDIAKYLADGNIEFLGRQDDQVKISGHRIELVEVELAISSIKGILQTVVIASNHLAGQTQLVAYIQTLDEQLDIADIRKKTSSILPDYMIPSYIVLVKNFPKTSSGKIDKRALPMPEYSRPSSAPLYKKATTEIQKNITNVWVDLLHIPEIGIDDNFFELGGTSILAQKVVAILLKDYNYKLPATKLYQFPKISELSNYLESKKNIEPEKIIYKSNKYRKSRDVAIIGMAGRFPGAQTIDELWEVLKEGKETITFFKTEELDPSITESLRNDPLYVRARGILPNANTFDASFFGINPKLAEAMDPQQRLFLEIAWEVLEKSGHLPKHYEGSIGVYAGTGTNTYYKNNIIPNKELLDLVGYLQIETVNEKDYIAPRTAYHLNLKGPTVSVHAACSTSLLAIAEAVEAIRNDHCDIALAGGSSITAPILSGHLYQEGYMLSPDGHSRPFDADGKGTVFSDGAGVVLLKNLEAAQKEGDTIYGIIKGIGISNDGGNKGSFTAPNAEGQAIAISKAMQDAQISPNSISYIETQGTATPLGDSIEIEGLKMAFGKQPINGYCAIGTIKSNIGHLTAASGVAGLIKTILALNNRLIPPSIGFEKPNPAIDFKESPFFVNQTLRNWESKNTLRAGVSSFGVGGTNVHIVLEEYPMENKISNASRPLQLLMWSAKSEHSSKAYKIALGNYINTSSEVSLEDIAYSLNKTRDSFTHRSFLLANSSIEASNELLANDSIKVKSNNLKVVPNELIFLFPGQGSQFSQMGMNLYQNETLYKAAVDRCATILLNEIQFDIRDILYPTLVTPESETRLNDPHFIQLAIFVTEYALSQLWLSWGIKPTALCGQNIGELVAAHLAGIFNLNEVLHLIAISSRLLSDFPSKVMDQILNDFEIEVKKIQLNKPNLPIVSTITGTWLKEDEAINPKYWSNHLQKTFKFEDALDVVLKLEDAIFLEVGPGQSLTSLIKQQERGKIKAAFSSLLLSTNQEIEYNAILNTLGELWLCGIEPDWNAFYGEDIRQKVNLPSYVFDRKYCWIDPPSIEIQNSKSNGDEIQNSINNLTENSPIRKDTILAEIASIISKTSGIVYANDSYSKNFLSLGLDSLALTQLTIKVKNEFKIPITFRQLNEKFNSPLLLAEYLDQNLSKEDNIKSNPTRPLLNAVPTNLSLIEDNQINKSNNHNSSILKSKAQQLEQLKIQIEKLQANYIILQNEVVKDNYHQLESNDYKKETDKTTIETKIEYTSDNKSDIQKAGIINKPPVPGAKLGRDKDGNPAWFIADSNNIGEYIKINL